MTATITGEARRDGQAVPVTGWPIWQGYTGWHAGQRTTIVDLLTSEGVVVERVRVLTSALEGVRVRSMARANDAFLARVAAADVCGQGERAAAELAWRERERKAEQQRRAAFVAARRERIARRAMAGVAR